MCFRDPIGLGGILLLAIRYLVGIGEILLLAIRSGG